MNPGLPEKRFDDSRFSSPAGQARRSSDSGLASPLGFQTPGLKRGGKQQRTFSDCSTAAPSPWMGPGSPSPWPSPFLGGADFQLGSPCIESRRNPDGISSLRPPSRAWGGLRTIPSFGAIQLPDFYDFTEILPPVDSGGAEISESLEIPIAAAPLPETPAPVAWRGPPAKPGAGPPHPLLLQALIRRSPEEVREALESEPDAARFPFWEHGAEPPLCAAVRLRCPAPIVQLLLEHGADASAADLRGQSPLSLAKRASLRDESVEELLEEAGGKASGPQACGADRLVVSLDGFPFESCTWLDLSDQSGLDLPRADGLPEPPCWIRT